MMVRRHDSSVDHATTTADHKLTSIKRVEIDTATNSNRPFDLINEFDETNWKKDLLWLILAAIGFMMILSLMHFYHQTSTTSSTIRLHRRLASSSSPPSSSTAAVGLETTSSSLQRHILSTPEITSTPSSLSFALSESDPRTPAERARSVNPHSPFRSIEDKLNHYREWEYEYQRLYEFHKDSRGTLMEFLGKAVAHLPVTPVPLHQTNRTVAFLEGRTDATFVLVLRHFMHLLGPGWGLIIFHTSENEDWFIDQFAIRAGGSGEHIVLQRVDPITFQQANSLVGSSAFYERIPCETILIIQSDTMILRSDYWPGVITDGPRLNDLLERYVYLGSPFSWCDTDWCAAGGNGGLSARQRVAMLDLTREIRCTTWECHWTEMFEEAGQQQELPKKHVEDTFFSYQLYDHAYKYKEGPESQIANLTTHAWFSIEGADYPDHSPYFCHKMWRYLSGIRFGSLMSRTMQYYPELWMTKEEIEIFKLEMAGIKP